MCSAVLLALGPGLLPSLCTPLPSTGAAPERPPRERRTPSHPATSSASSPASLVLEFLPLLTLRARRCATRAP
eukprot:4947958-Pleurochrysis_carterae.AAC.1